MILSKPSKVGSSQIVYKLTTVNYGPATGVFE